MHIKNGFNYTKYIWFFVLVFLVSVPASRSLYFMMQQEWQTEEATHVKFKTDPQFSSVKKKFKARVGWLNS